MLQPYIESDVCLLALSDFKDVIDYKKLASKAIT